jgi:hypothetical protein
MATLRPIGERSSRSSFAYGGSVMLATGNGLKYSAGANNGMCGR